MAFQRKPSFASFLVLVLVFAVITYQLSVSSTLLAANSVQNKSQRSVGNNAIVRSEVSANNDSGPSFLDEDGPGDEKEKEEEVKDTETRSEPKSPPQAQPESVVPPMFHYGKGMDDRMFPAFLELLPDETISLPVFDKNNNLVFGGKPIEHGNYKNKKACSYPILDDTRPIGRCCLGARSAGGEQRYGGVDVGGCNQNVTAYREVQEHALQDMESYPVQFDKNNPRNSPASHIRCDICRIVQIVASMKHKRFAIVGDSVQSQLFVGLECELRRRNFEVVANPLRKWEEENHRLPDNRISWKYGIRGETCLNVTVPEWMKVLNSNSQYQNDRSYEPSSHVAFCFYSHYRPYPDMVQHKAIAKSNDVTMINYGVHFLGHVEEQMDEFEQSLELLLKAFHDSGSLLMYRETSAQHYDMNGGEWDARLTKQQQDGTLKCVPINGTSDLIKWRTKVFRNVANRTGTSIVHSFQSQEGGLTNAHSSYEVAFLPFFDWTAKLLSLKSGVDCTHFCYTPHIYSSMWRHIRNALDRYDTPRINR